VHGRTAYDRAGPDDDDQGWGSPVPAEYGSLRSVRPGAEDRGVREVAGPAPPAEEHLDRTAVISTLLRRLQGEGAAAVVAPATSLLRRLQGDGTDVVADPAEPEVSAENRAEPLATVVGPVTLPDDAQLVSDLEAAARTRRRPRRRVVPARTRATVRHLSISSVLRVSIIFWLVMLAAVVVASVLLWIFADAFGSLPSIEKSIRTLFSLKSFKLHPGQVAFYTFLGGLVVSIAGVFANLLFALIYNLIADVVGGVKVDLDHLSSGD
jgi:hypothetical protein